MTANFSNASTERGDIGGVLSPQPTATAPAPAATCDLPSGPGIWDRRKSDEIAIINERGRFIAGYSNGNWSAGDCDPQEALPRGGWRQLSPAGSREREPCNGSCQIALARRQVGNQGVPGNARECAEMWHQQADIYREALFAAAAKLESIAGALADAATVPATGDLAESVRMLTRERDEARAACAAVEAKLTEAERELGHYKRLRKQAVAKGTFLEQQKLREASDAQDH